MIDINKREKELFEMLLTIMGNIHYDITEQGIILYDSQNNLLCDSDNEIMYFKNTIDAINSIDWLFTNMETKDVFFADPNEIEKIEQEERE